MEDVAAVYGRSLFEAAQDKGELDEVREQLGEISDAIAGDHDLQVFFFSPSLTSEQQKVGLHKAVTDANELVGNFLELLIDNHRMSSLFKIREELDTLADAENQLLPVQIVSAVELDEKTVKQVGDQIAEQTGQQVEMSTAVDPDVLGGLVVRVGNTVLDASIRRRLDHLRKEVARAA